MLLHSEEIDFFGNKIIVLKARNDNNITYLSLAFSATTDFYLFKFL